MTIRRRLFWSNILMILVPVIMTVLIGLLCVAVIWMTLLRGARLDQRDQEDFEHICMAITEVIINWIRRMILNSCMQCWIKMEWL